MYDRACPNFTNTHFNCRSDGGYMQKPIPALHPKAQHTPGMPYHGRQIDAVEIPPGQVMLLWSPWGIEGVFTRADLVSARYDYLNNLGAYRGEPFSIQLVRLDASPEID